VSRLGIINNVQAGRTRARLPQLRELVARCDADVREVRDLPSIIDATHELLATNVELLAINGGDGTAQAVITELQRAGGPQPEIAVLPGGTTNLTAHDLNGRLGIEAAFRTLMKQHATPTEQRQRVRRPLLAISWTGQPVEYGFFLGAGAILAGMRHFREHLGSRGLRDELAAGLSLLRGLAGVAGREHAWSDHHTEVLVADRQDFAGRQNLVLATTLERLLLGLKPWWGDEQAPLHLTALGHRPQNFLRVIPSILRGKMHQRATPANGYLSANVTGLALTAAEGFALDGQIFTPPAGTEIRVEATKPLEFIGLGP